MTRNAIGTDETMLSSEPGPVEAASLWKAMTTEAGTGVTVITLDGRIVYANDEVAQMIFGPGAVGSGYAGQDMREVFPEEWADENAALLARFAATDDPIVARIVWRGMQLLSWLHRIDSEAPEGGGDGSALPDRVLIVTRRVAGDEEIKRMVLSGVEVFESGVSRLGSLALLSSRELEVLALVGQGLTLEQIGRLLFRSPKTIAHNREQLGKKLLLGDRVRLAEVAWRAGLTVKDAERKRI